MDNGINPKLDALLSFAWEMRHYVTSMSPWRSRPGPLLSFDGTIRVSDVNVVCSFEIDWEWSSIPPSVACREDWIRREVDWHAFSDGRLCWVYPHLWRDVIYGIKRSLPADCVLQMAVYWCVEHSSSLIAKHLEADRMAYGGKWPKEWDAWAHGDAATPEYEEAKRKGKVNRVIQSLLAKRAV